MQSHSRATLTHNFHNTQRDTVDSAKINFNMEKVYYTTLAVPIMNKRYLKLSLWNKTATVKVWSLEMYWVSTGPKVDLLFTILIA